MPAITAAGFTLALLLASCTAPPAPSPLEPDRPAPLPAAGSTPAPPLPPAPAPEPQDPPPVTTGPPPTDPVQEKKDPAPATGTATPKPPATKPGPTPSPSPNDPGPSATAVNTSPPTRTVTTYYVMLDDGGSNGVRFGCNDSLVGVDHSSAAAEEALPAAIRALLEGTPAPVGKDLYNSLSGSQLKFLSGSYDGTTVTVYLSGSLRLGGVCDIPRVEAQLTQTAVAAVGAIRAEIYVNGRSLADTLRQD